MENKVRLQALINNDVLVKKREKVSSPSSSSSSFTSSSSSSSSQGYNHKRVIKIKRNVSITIGRERDVWGHRC